VQAAVAAEEDWKRDSNGKSHLTEPMVANSMFELADIWCLSTNIEEYVAFLDQLLGTVTMEKDGKTVRTYCDRDSRIYQEDVVDDLIITHREYVKNKEAPKGWNLTSTDELKKEGKTVRIAITTRECIMKMSTGRSD
jgi:hypothetical protein